MLSLKDRCLHHLIEAQALRTPGELAVAFEGQSLTYGELDHRAGRVADELRERGAGPETIVGLFVERSLELVVGILGILKSGAAYAPIDPEYPKERLAFMLRDANVACTLTQQELAALLPADAPPPVCLDSLDWTTASPRALPEPSCGPDNLAYVMYTSGSTGRPKGVCVEHRNIVSYVLSVADRLRFEPGMNHATVSGIAADLGLTVVFPALVTGGCLHVISKERAENQARLAEYFRRERIDVLKIVPSHLAALQTGPDAGGVMPRRRLILGGEASRLEWIEQLRALSPECEIHNHYGPTEATVGAMSYRVEGPLPRTASGTLPLGTPLPHCSVRILDADRKPVPAGEEGELYIGGGGVARGYLNRPELTAERFIPDPFGASPGERLYRTGDLARALPDGTFEFCGRIDDQVKVRGYRVELGEIEAAIREHPGIAAAVVAHDPERAQLAAYVVPRQARQALWNSRAVHLLPDGSQVAHLNRNETEYLYDEIFVRQAYLRHGITVRDGDCVVDAGANIGLFTVFAGRLARDLRIIAFEPNPAAFACLEANVEMSGTPVTCLPVGLSSENRTADLTFFEGMSLLSGFYANAETERSVVKQYVLNQQSVPAIREGLASELDDVIDARLQARTVPATLRTLSDVIAEQGVERIDLLKINVEKSELDVLRGLEPRDWPRIRQMVIEVDDSANLAPIVHLLEQHGFEVLSEQDPLLRDTALRYVYAIRPSRTGERLIEEQPAGAHLCTLPAPDGQVLTPQALRAYLKERLPQHMIPASFVLMDKFPLTASGKVDRQALSRPALENAPAPRGVARPLTETEETIAAIWRELLHVETISLTDDFFDLGGHSLLAIRAMARVRDLFGLEMHARTLFENPTIRELSRALTAARGSGGHASRIERRQDGGACALSFAQEQLWFLDQLAPRSPAYTIVDVIPVRGPYDAGAMRRTLGELVRRHEVLRTAFETRDGQPVQVVHPETAWSLPEIDLTALSPPEKESEWSRIVHDEGRRPFDLSHAGLMRVTAVHMSREEHRLLVAIHHIAADEWSMELIQQEVAQLYHAFTHGLPSPLPELPIQFADFACWQREWLQGEALERETSYWRQELAGAPPVLELVTDRPRPALQGFDGATEGFEIPAESLARLKALGREEHATLFMVLEAAFAALLHRATGQDDILIGTPISGRRHSETEGLIGCFLNTVVLRSTLTPDLSFRALLRQARERALGAFAHPDLPFERLVAELAPEPDPSRTPLAQVMFVLHNSGAASQVSKVSGNRQLATGTSKFDLTFLVSETDDRLEGLIEYRTDLFEDGTMRRLGEHYQVLLDALAREPDRAVSRLPLMTDVERRRLEVDWNDTATVFPGGDLRLHDLLERQVERTPERAAVECDGERLTYRELDGRAGRLARSLADLGVGSDTLVGLLTERSLDMVVGLLGILKAGGAYVPLDPAFPAERLAHMVADSGMQVLVTHRELDRILPAPPPAIVRLDAGGVALDGQSQALGQAPVSTPESLAYVLYTSGSTGMPKGVQIPHSAIVNFLLSMQSEPGFGPEDTLLAVTTLSFDIAALELYLPLISGGRVVVASRDEAGDPDRLQERMRECGCTVMQATPATWRALVESGWSGSASLKALCGGEALPPDLARALVPRCAGLWNLYGPTETTVWSTLEKIVSTDRGASIGRPIANTQVFVLDAYRSLVPPGLIGELYIGGRGLARGYWRREALTNERFVRSPFQSDARLYRTGDLGRWLPDGRLEWLGRSDHQLKVRGFRIEPGEIEAALTRHPRVREAVVIAREDAPGDKRLVAYYVADPASGDLADELRAGVRSGCPEYMVPSAFVRLDRFPRTPNGKLNRSALPAPGTGDVAARADAVAPRTATEETLMGLFRDVVGRADFGVFDSFFDLGGHSLMAARLMSLLRSTADVDLGLRDLFERPTVAALAQAVDALSLPVPPPARAGDGAAREEIEL